MILDKIREMIADQLGDPDVKVQMETDLMEDLRADSLDAVEIIMAVEEEYGIDIPGEDADRFRTVGDIVRYIETKA